MRLNSIYLFLFIIGTCFGQDSQIKLDSFFTQTEINDLKTITDFFQEQTCGTNDREKFEMCIQSLTPDLTQLDRIFTEHKINYRKQERLYKQISKSTFDLIWSKCKTIRLEKPIYEYNELCFSGNEQFIDFVLALGESNNYLKYYGEKLENVGSFDGGNYLISNIKMNPTNWNLKNTGVQILLAIHFLTQNDHIERDKKAIRLEKRDLRKLNKQNGKKSAHNNGS